MQLLSVSLQCYIELSVRLAMPYSHPNTDFDVNQSINQAKFATTQDESIEREEKRREEGYKRPKKIRVLSGTEPNRTDKTTRTRMQGRN